jgi:hypothetical protein
MGKFLVGCVQSCGWRLSHKVIQIGQPFFWKPDSNRQEKRLVNSSSVGDEPGARKIHRGPGQDVTEKKTSRAWKGLSHAATKRNNRNRQAAATVSKRSFQPMGVPLAASSTHLGALLGGL